MATTGTEAAEKAFRSAEERFLANDLDGALRVSRNAKRHLASLPALQNALIAYEVHAAAGRGGKRNCWYAVLGVGQPVPVARDHDAIKKRYRRLCLVLHPDKNRSAAADGAFKLLQRAWEALSARHPPGRAGGPSSDPGTGAKPRPPPGAPGAKPRPPPPGAPDSDWWSYFRYKPPPERTWSSYGYTPPPPPPSGNFSSWRSRYASKRGTAYCGHCGSGPESAAAGGGAPGGRCHACGTDFNPPPQSQSQSQSQAEEGASAPPPAGTAGAAEPPPRRHDVHVTTTGRSSGAPPSAGGARRPSRRWCPAPASCARSSARPAPTTPTSTCTAATGRVSVAETLSTSCDGSGPCQRRPWKDEEAARKIVEAKTDALWHLVAGPG